MYSGLEISRIFGVRIHADWSWIFILSMAAWTMSVAVLPYWYPEWDAALTVVMAVAAAILLFVSVLVHELAHLIAAKANHILVSHTTLFLFGGVPALGGEPASPRAELGIALAGPGQSLLIGLLSLFLAFARAGGLESAVAALQARGRPDPLAMLLLWVGMINLWLSALNVLPGFPLDGGRLLRLLLWRMGRNLRWAMHGAVRAGLVIAWGLVAAGILLVLTARGPFSQAGLAAGLALAIAGGCLQDAALQSDHFVSLQDLLKRVPAALPLSARVPTVPPNIPLTSLMDDYGVATAAPAFPVVDRNYLVGLICTGDVHKVPREKWDTTEVGEVMTSANRLAIARPVEAGTEAIEDWAHHAMNGVAWIEISQKEES